ncbi:MAG: hypothetical protein JRI95_08645 [Deltaproteobacteria bacterium]|nr:hypothetical protein [Deltaproteobacteria bacterium]MBW2085570.1 hypothetical protein [Deltaproteobacteria bacterium]
MKKERYFGQALPPGLNNRNYIQKRLSNFSLTMIVMGISFILYYLGLFGNVEGPLQPGQLGEKLAAMGVSRIHVLLFFITVLAITIAWNWIYNLVSLLTGARLTCTKKMDNGNTVCGASVTREKVAHNKTGIAVTRYVCSHGHERFEATFNPVKKGTLGHTVWVISLLFCIMAFCLT